VAKANSEAFAAKENVMKLKVRLNIAAAKQTLASKAAAAENTRNAAHRAWVEKQLVAIKAKYEAAAKAA
jgi:hypothetical protein